MKKTARFNFFIKLTILVVICFCAVNIIRLRNDFNNLRDQERELLEEKERYEDEIAKLKEDLLHDMDDEYIMRIAREKLNYYLPDEIIFFNDR
jgi:cell division protein FtsB